MWSLDLRCVHFPSKLIFLNPSRIKEATQTTTPRSINIIQMTEPTIPLVRQIFHLFIIPLSSTRTTETATLEPPTNWNKLSLSLSHSLPLFHHLSIRLPPSLNVPPYLSLANSYQIPNECTPRKTNHYQIMAPSLTPCDWFYETTILLSANVDCRETTFVNNWLF